MSRILIVYFSLSGNTEKMAQYISEGVRFSGNEATMRKTSDIKKSEELQGYIRDGFLVLLDENFPFYGQEGRAGRQEGRRLRLLHP